VAAGSVRCGAGQRASHSRQSPRVHYQRRPHMGRIDRLNPGDLISSSLFNSLIGYIEELEGRIDSLKESGTDPKISSIHPIEPIVVGDLVTISGNNFGNIGEREVVVDGTIVKEM